MICGQGTAGLTNATVVIVTPAVYPCNVCGWNVTTFNPQTLATFHPQPISEAKLVPPFTLCKCNVCGWNVTTFNPQTLATFHPQPISEAVTTTVHPLQMQCLRVECYNIQPANIGNIPPANIANIHPQPISEAVTPVDGPALFAIRRQTLHPYTSCGCNLYI